MGFEEVETKKNKGLWREP